MYGTGKIAWNELNTWDAEAAKAFYGKALGWHFQEGPVTPEGRPPYWLADHDGERVGGVFTLTSPEHDGVPSHWLAYVAVDDIAVAVAGVKAAGGRVYREPFEIPHVGTIAVVADSTGASFGLFQPPASGGNG